MGPIWSGKHNRIVMESELLTAMGWHVTKQRAQEAGVKQFIMQDGINYTKLIGNSMHLTVLSAVMLAALVSCKFKVSRRPLPASEAELRDAFAKWVQLA